MAVQSCVEPHHTSSLGATPLAGELSPNEGCKTWAPRQPLSNKAVRHILGKISDDLLHRLPKF